MKDKILIFGASGQVGQALVGQCPLSFSLALPSHQSVDFLKEGALRDYVAHLAPKLVINCVAYNQVDKAEVEQEKVSRINADAVEELAQACAKQNIPLIHFSTDYVFTGKTPLATQARYCESDETGPVNHYGKTKLLGELAVSSFPANLVLRVSWVFSEYAQNMGRNIATQAQQSQVLRVATDQFGSPTYAGHIATVVWLLVNELMSGAKGGVYHLSGEEAVSRCQFAQTIIEELKRQGKLSADYQLVPTTQAQWVQSAAISAAKRPAFSALDSARLAKRLGTPLPTWREGVKAFVAGI